MTNEIDLAASFAELKRQARSWDEVADWVKEHPAAIPGIAELLSLKLAGLRVFSNRNGVTESILKKGGLRVTLSVHTNMHCSLGPELQSCHESENVYHKTSVASQEFHLRATLAEWPLLTALGAVDYLNDASSRSRSDEFQQAINTHLALHFPSVSLTILEELRDSELLPMDSEGNVNDASIVNLLFDSRHPTIDNSLPVTLVS